MLLADNTCQVYRFGMDLFVWRQRKKWSLRRMAFELWKVADTQEPCAGSTVLMWETGRTAPSLVYVDAIQRLTRGKVKVADLLRTARGAR